MLRVEGVMGVPIRIDVRDPDADPAAVQAAFDWFVEVDERFSTWKPTSEISRINRGELAVEDAHPDVAAVLDRCRELGDLTGGYFDAWAVVHDLPGDGRDASVFLPGAVEPSGLVKGWAVDRAGRLLAASGARNFSVYAGGDIRTRGAALPAPVWRVGIQHPQQGDAIAAVVEGRDLAVATSGQYERGDHVIDPHTGRAPRDILSATIVGDDLGTADAYATAALAMGAAAAPEWVTQLVGYDALLILADGTMLSTRGFPFGKPA